jgi:hypothetical protein
MFTDRKRLNRIGCGIVGLLVVSVSAARLYRGEMNYENWFGELVFVPIALGLGFVCLLAAIFDWERVYMPRGPHTRKPGRY